MTRLACLAASLGPIGLFPLAPATLASLVLALVYLLLPASVPAVAEIGYLVLITAVGVWAADRAESVWGHDASRIVIDEAAGMAVTLFMMPPGFEVAAAGFIAFRFFDIVKPPPCRRAERLPGGWGVVTDDLCAGVYAHLAVRLVLPYL